jgi:hypothetical protein
MDDGDDNARHDTTAARIAEGFMVLSSLAIDQVDSTATTISKPALLIPQSRDPNLRDIAGSCYDLRSVLAAVNLRRANDRSQIPLL